MRNSRDLENVHALISEKGLITKRNILLQASLTVNRDSVNIKCHTENLSLFSWHTTKMTDYINKAELTFSTVN